MHATPETAFRASKVRQGALARLYEAGDLTIEQLGASQEILSVHERITGPVTVSTASLEARVDQSRMGDEGFFEALGQVRREVAYGRWRSALAGKGGTIGPVMAMIVGDYGVAQAARSARMRTSGMKRLLSSALDLWSYLLLGAIREIDEAELLAAQAGLF